MSESIPATQEKLVRDIMTTEVIKIYPETKVGDVARLMTQHAISGLPVVDQQEQVLGVVTERDMIFRNTRFRLPGFIMILDSIIPLETSSHYRDRLQHTLGTTAREIMSEPAVTISPDATIEELAEVMIDRRMNPVPVVQNGRLVGIVSRSDIIRLMAIEFE